jgi:hypothetical protein
LSGLILAACGSTPATTGGSYPTYAYTCCTELTEITVWQPGQQVILHWQSQAFGSSTSPLPQPVTLRLTLTGPFGSVEALKAAIARNQLPSGVRSISANTPRVTDRTGGTPASELNLPGNLLPGYYNLEAGVSVEGNSASGSSVVTIQ